jgi:glycosyltransferase involved in cell wall biosynthesis
MPIPILLISDAPDSGTGLGRITKDLAMILSGMPEFRVATFGRGGLGSRHLPWPQYVFDESQQWGEGLLIKACEDFNRDENFIIMTVWDASRLFWFYQPNTLPETPLKDFLTSGKFKRWGYFPIDAWGPYKKLSTLTATALQGCDRPLAYSKFGQQVIENTFGLRLDFIPHGIDNTVFYPRGKQEGRETLGVESDAKLVGCVMTNQARKDWGVWAQTARILLDQDPSYQFWAHVDVLERHWSLPALIADYNLGDHVKITQSVTDDTLAKLYSACDVTFLPSLGEGFGYPIAESLACGVPAIHHDYGAGSEIIPNYTLVDRPAVIHAGDMEEYSRLDTLHNVYRPILDPVDWAYRIRELVTRWDPKILQQKSVEGVEHLFWKNLTPVWENWFRQGLNGQ